MAEHVHSEDDLGVRCKLGSDVTPKSGENVVTRASLTDNLSIESGVIVNINDT